MNKAKVIRYAKGKAVRRVESECGEVSSMGIGVSGSIGSDNHPFALRIKYIAPDERETVLLIDDVETLKRLVKEATAIIDRKEDK